MCTFGNAFQHARKDRLLLPFCPVLQSSSAVLQLPVLQSKQDSARVLHLFERSGNIYHYGRQVYQYILIINVLLFICKEQMSPVMHHLTILYGLVYSTERNGRRNDETKDGTTLACTLPHIIAPHNVHVLK